MTTLADLEGSSLRKGAYAHNVTISALPGPRHQTKRMLSHDSTDSNEELDVPMVCVKARVWV